MKKCMYWQSVLSFTKGIRYLWLIHWVVSCCHVALSLYFIFLCKSLIDVAAGESEGRVFPLGYLLLGVVVMQIICSAVKSWLTADCEIKLKNNLCTVFFADLMSSHDLLHKCHTGDVVNILEEDVKLVAETLGRTIPTLLATCIQFTIAFYYLYKLDVFLACLILLVMPVCLFFSRVMMRKIKVQTLHIREEEAKIQVFLQEHIQHIELLQTLQQETRSVFLLSNMMHTLYEKVIYRVQWQVISRMWVGMAFASGYVVAFIWGVNGVASGKISFGLMVAFLQLAGQIQYPLLEMSRSLPSLIHTTASIDRLISLRKLHDRDSCVSSVLYSCPVGITFQQVSFSYPDGSHQVLKHFSYDFLPGSITAIVGESGAGKSTLFRLLLALYKPQHGFIEIYANSFRRKVDESTRVQFVYVPQGNSLLSGSIRENLLLGNPEATEQEMWRALEVAVAGFVAHLPLGLDTPCFELGGGLSEGQAQRIAIARALLRKGNVYLFDEITASLDVETEQHLIDNILENCKFCTLLFVTHRPYILSHCDYILSIGL